MPAKKVHEIVKKIDLQVQGWRKINMKTFISVGWDMIYITWDCKRGKTTLLLRKSIFSSWSFFT